MLQYESALDLGYTHGSLYADLVDASAGLKRLNPTMCTVYETLPDLGDVQTMAEPKSRAPRLRRRSARKDILFCRPEHALNSLDYSSSNTMKAYSESDIVLIAAALRMSGQYGPTRGVYDKALEQFPDSNALVSNRRAFLAERKQSRLMAEKSRLMDEKAAQEKAEAQQQAQRLVEQLKAKYARVKALVDRYEDCKALNDEGLIDLGREVLRDAQFVLQNLESDSMVDGSLAFADIWLRRFEALRGACD